MKKTLWTGIASTVLLMAACNDTAVVKDDAVAPSSDLTLEQVFNKTLERQQALKSVSADMTMEQAMEMDLAGEMMKMDSMTTMKMDIVNEPIQLYANGTTAMTDPSSGEQIEMPIQMYMTEKDGFYMYEENIGWYTLPQDQFAGIMEQAGVQNDPSEQLRQLQQFISDFTFEQTDDAFILTLNAEGDKFMALLLEEASTALGAVGEEAQTALEGTTVEGADYVLTIDKETFDLTQISMDLIMTMDTEGMVMKIDQSTDVAYNHYNDVETITIPQEVLDQAQALQ